MKWYELGTSRKEVADDIMTADCERVCDGYNRTEWIVQQFGSHVLLHSYDRRNVYNQDEGKWIAENNPFYRAQVSYRSEQQAVSAMIDFNGDHAMLVRSSELCMPVQELPNPFVAWDEAMSALDESLQARVQQLGLTVVATMIERVPEQSFTLVA